VAAAAVHSLFPFLDIGIIGGFFRLVALVGALFLGIVAILPWLVDLFAKLLPGGGAGTSGSNIMLITSTGLLIVVGVVLDTMRQLEAQLQMRHYDKFLRRGILG